ncbi:UDP-N-acetylmuramoyl-L-alanyl-D-glutamate--2,6-diaminopimelate ligase [Thioalkalivibrio sp. HK1]|uniref:UDP-N-acetylmuramoyl-L-alanyl-D-glutamate--2, 6-diaminopimelate ligase n=1 Tax=Thioalkalivibrio sp. HK1 TaxID=1469245 RepID=UPI0018CC3D32|nr:UDP-N-acetylmuramoyl-L-alanyl-D-glutamate--2,6-diaminopimelate ligase [Thioalkalivibrio sp. HK1]
MTFSAVGRGISQEAATPGSAAEPAPSDLPRLAYLLEGHALIPPAFDRGISQVCDDSREVIPGALFFARRGGRVDARRFVADAIGSGAKAVVIEGDQANPCWDRGAVVVGVADIVGAIGHAADRFHDHPSRHLKVAAITGTNGKTSVAYLAALGGGERWAFLGTLGSGTPDRIEDSPLTTPGTIEIQKRLARFRDRGFAHVALEASSHALEQRRLEGVSIRTAAFTNLSRDHLDYHRTMEDYARAKSSLFDIMDLEYAVINRDDPHGSKLLETLAPRMDCVAITLDDSRSLDPKSRLVRGRISSPRQDDPLRSPATESALPGLSLEIDSPFGRGRLDTRLIGAFNAYNLLIAITIACLHGHPFEDVIRRLTGAGAVSGRMQALGGGSKPLAVIDYAHTPEALLFALKALRSTVPGTLWCIFGCGGERDRGKRAQMARAAQAVADRVIVSDDNPRGEDADAIVADILGGFEAPEAVIVERDRALAIRHAIESAHAGDAVLIAGKGHENWQEIGGHRRPFSDLEQAHRALDAKR